MDLFLLGRHEVFVLREWDMKSEEKHATSSSNFPKVVTLGTDKMKESKKLSAEEELQKSLREGTLKTAQRLSPESRIPSGDPTVQAKE